MTEIVLGISMFTGVMLALVAMLLAARRKLVASGEVSILINGDTSKPLKVAAGSTLSARSRVTVSSSRPHAAGRERAACAR